MLKVDVVTGAMRNLPVLALLALPTAAHAAGPRTAPELSDVALAAVAVAAVWFVRRALRARFDRGDHIAD